MKNKRIRRLMPVILTLTIIAVTFFSTAGTALAVDVIGTTYTLDSSDVVLDVSGTSTITSDGTEYTNVAINCADGTNLTIENVNINNDHDTEVYVSPITINGTCTLNFVGENTLTADDKYAAVQVEESASVTLDGTGKLTVQGGDDAAGIGGGYMTYATGITINGGEIIANGGDDGAGIGYGYCGGHDATSPLTINIKGGDITAHGDGGGAGIGYGYGSGEGTSTPGMIINIEGGDIEAIGGEGGAGIGLGDESKEDTIIINISGGKIFAISEDEGAGIGSGDEYDSTGAQNSTINISGGWIEAQGYCCGTAIGAGDDAPWGTINLSGGVINAWADSEDDIGEGCCGWLEDGVYITGSAIVIPYHDLIFREDHSESQADFGTHRRIEATISESGTPLTKDTKIVLHSTGGLFAPTWIGENDDTHEPWFVAYVPDGTYYFTKDDGEKRTDSFTVSGADVTPTLNFASVLLDDMAVSEGTLAPVFDSDTFDYEVTVANDIDSIKITPTLHELDDTVTVAGTAVASGAASGEIALSIGENEIDVVVTDGTETTVKNTYTVKVTRASALLHDLNASEGTLAPVFDSDTFDYEVTVANDIDSIKITPTLHDLDDSVTVAGTAVASGAASGDIALSVGDNEIAVVVTDGTLTTVKNTYTITVTRASALLHDLKVSKGTLAPVFDSETFDYEITVANDIDSLKITPTLHELDDSVTVAGTAVASGAASGDIALSIGENEIDVVVTDGTLTTVKSTYTVTVTREAKEGPDIEGELIDQDGDEISGWTIILKSTPVTVVTDAQGKFSFKNVTLGNHTLTIKNTSGSVIKTLNLSYIEGSTFGWSASGDDLSIVVTPQTGTVYIKIEVDSNNAVAVKSVSDKIENPETGDTRSFIWIWIMVAIAALRIGASAVRKTVKNK